jgi:hypothetical protein
MMMMMTMPVPKIVSKALIQMEDCCRSMCGIRDATDRVADGGWC